MWSLSRLVLQATQDIDRAETWHAKTALQGRRALEAGARRFALSLGYALERALLAYHAQWSLTHENDARAAAAASRLATDSESLAPIDLGTSFALANDTPLPTRPPIAETVPEVSIADVPTPGSEWGDGAPPPFS